MYIYIEKISMKSIVHYFVQVFLRWDCARSKEELYKQILSCCQVGRDTAVWMKEQVGF